MSEPLPRDNVWEDEFPIDKDKEAFVTRRQFTKFLVLTSLGMFVGNLWILFKSLLSGKVHYPQKVIAKLDELAPGTVKIFNYPGDGDPCILIKTPSNELFAYSQKCTHLSCPVQYSSKSNRLECPCHDGHFSVATGEVLQGPPPRPLPRVVLEERDNLLLAVSLQIGEHE
jgi:nitrite reductase/ring-hydroxylating ferredoxin subunit